MIILSSGGRYLKLLGKEPFIIYDGTIKLRYQMSYGVSSIVTIGVVRSIKMSETLCFT